MKTASYFTRLDDHKVRCELCPHHCVIREGKRGFCLTRQNKDGILVSANYCRPVSTAVDPIEKKPLYHFRPGRTIFSTGPNGCTFKCSFCQNCEISQEILPTREVSAAKLARSIIDSRTIGAAYTYSEPYIWYETIMDVGSRVKEAGLCNVMVTNGYMEPAPLDDLLRIVDAMNIDIKSMNPDFYRRLCKGELQPVLRTCETVKKHAHLEITNLLITGENDSENEIRKLVSFIATNLGSDTPLHISRYFPRYKLAHPATAERSLLSAWELAREKLDFVYLGNTHARDKADTFCPSCGALLVTRSGYRTAVTRELARQPDGSTRCGTCSRKIALVPA
ncbi:MAG: AmmeMemoRadiSam system radical SAM enzyme [Chitinivibrionales bacterium]|nr:AmmeMemoRadiSam system radical SAM enzyme [Chitinivibrionales bacterium]MBD3394875.1 AmmeMemoRadiSam system radical SAM enzyme [Chitinivibrionales bacterium]